MTIFGPLSKDTCNFFSKYLSFIAILLSILFPIASFAQNFAIKESTTEYADFLHDFIYVNPSRYVCINYSGPHGAFSMKRDDKTTIVSGYDAALKEIYSLPVKELGGKKYEGAVSFHNQVSLFFSDNAKLYKCAVDVNKGTLINPPIEIGPATAGAGNFMKGFSADSTRCYAICRSHESKSKDELYSGVVMDSQSNVLTRFSFTAEGLREYVANRTCVLSAEGALHIIQAIRVKAPKDDYRPLQYVVTDVGVDGISTTTLLSGLPEGLFADVTWRDNGNALSFSGLLAKTKKIGFQSVLSGEYRIADKKLTNLAEKEYSNSPALQNNNEKYVKEIQREGIPQEASLASTYSDADGSTLLILEKTQFIETFSNGFNYTDVRSGDLYVLRVKANHELDWIKAIPKNQLEPMAYTFTGILSMPDQHGGIFLFFQDNQRNENIEPGGKATQTTLQGGWRNISLAEIHIDKDGGMTKKFIFDNSAVDFHLAPQQPFLVHNKVLIFTSYNQKTLGRSNFRVGTIEVH